MTDDLVKRLRLCKCSDLEQIEAADAIEALKAERCVEVRPLEWVDQDTGHLSADSFGLTYEVGRENFEFYWSELSSDKFGDGFKDAIKAAKAAQSDYERRILSAITTRPASEVRAEAHAAAIEAAASAAEGYGGGDSYAARMISEAIRTLHTDASRAALSKLDVAAYQKGRAEALREVEEIAALAITGDADARDIHAAITALIEKDKDDD